MVNRWRITVLLAFGFILFSGCGLIGAIIIATSYNAKITINERYVKSSHGLTNGVLFEKLAVVTLDDKGIPENYIVTQRFKCYNPGVEGVQKYWPDKLYFNKINGHYKWRTDTAGFYYTKKGNYRERIVADSINYTFDFKGLDDTISKKVKGDLNEIFIFDSKVYDTCPVDFKTETWYFINFYDPVLASVYLFVDTNKKFTIYTYGTGVSPI